MKWIDIGRCCHDLYHSMNCMHKWQGKYVPIYEFVAGECGLVKPKQEGYYDVVMKSHEAMQCFLLVDAGSVPSLSAMFLTLRFIVKV